MLSYVEFRSDRFPAYEGEEAQINPGLWGKRLAEFLREKLLAEGFMTQEPVAEDWGWRIGVDNEGFSLWIGLRGDIRNIPMDFIVSSNRMRLRWVPSSEESTRGSGVASLRRSLDKVLAGGIGSIRWWTHEEFKQFRSQLTRHS